MRRYVKIILLLLVSFIQSADADPLTMDISCDEWPPYQTVDELGHVNGFSTKIVKAVFDRMEIRINPVTAYPWKRALNNVKTGYSHALYSANYTLERTSFVYYPDEPLVYSPWVIWVKKDSKNAYSSLNDLKGKTIGVVNGYSYTQGFWDFIYKYSYVEKVTSDEINFKKLQGGRVEFIIAELGNGYHILRELGYENIIPFKNHPIKSDGLYIVFNKERVSKDLVDRFSKKLRAYKKEPEYKKLKKEYFPE